MVKRFLRYVQIDSESCNEKAMCEVLLGELTALGLSPYMDQAGAAIGSNGGNIICSVPGTLQGECLLLCAHVDTVKPGCGVRPTVQEGCIVTDRRTVLGGDDKSGVAIIMETVEEIILSGRPHRPLEILFTIGEEIGVKGSEHLDYSQIRSKEAIVIDSQGTVGDIKVFAPGKNKLSVTVYGKAAHAGACPEKGVSAIFAASCGVANMRLLRIDEETTANIGSFLASGATNVVNDTVHIEAEVRSQSIEKLNAQCAHMIRCLTDAAEQNGAHVEYTIEAGTQPYRVREDHPLIAEVRTLCLNERLPVRVFGDGGGSDANRLARHGIAPIALGCGMDKVHTTEEYLCIRDFCNTAHILENLLTIARDA
ncbi:MAG: M20/M25/M40 family metallo-hydrolase [Eubacteriales bacterium]|nr:M20/M25/M40 family metallo-hydrolase [Eubacteriales bacterium]